MFANLGRGLEIDLDPPSPTGVDFLLNHAFVAAQRRHIRLNELINLYRFCNNNPVSRVDPTGLVSFFSTRCASAEPKSDTSGCYVHRGIVLFGMDAECVCRCAGSTPWDNYVRGCLECAQCAGVPPEEAHGLCYTLADRRYGRFAGAIERIDIAIGCQGCAVSGETRYGEYTPLGSY